MTRFAFAAALGPAAEPPTTINRKVISAKPRARVFTAGRVQPDPDTVIEEQIAAESVLEGPPRSLVLTVGPQLSAAYGKRAPQLWSEPLDDPIPLNAVLAQAEAMPAPPGSAPWWPLGEIDRPRQLSHGLLTYSLEGGGNVSILGMKVEDVSRAVQTFLLAAAARYSPREVGFYVMSYGGPALAPLKDLPHVGVLGGGDRKELNLRVFGDLEALAARRRKLFEHHGIGSVAEFRERRRLGNHPGLDDGYPTDIFLVIDGWENFLTDNTSLMHPKNPHLKSVERLIGAGRGIHVRFLRMRDPVARADLRPLRLPRHRTWSRNARGDLLLLSLRRNGRRTRAGGSRRITNEVRCARAGRRDGSRAAQRIFESITSFEYQKAELR